MWKKSTGRLARPWSRARLRQEQPWARSWAGEDCCSGVAGRGAEDAWFGTALEAEDCSLRSIPVAFASVDLSKCFDRVVRPLVMAMLAVGGFPLGVLAGYAAFHAQLTVRYTVHGGVGPLRRRPRGLPQGDPWSMLFLAKMLQPWAAAMQDRGLVAEAKPSHILHWSHWPA